MSSYMNSFLRKGIDSIFVRIIAPINKRSGRISEQDCNGDSDNSITISNEVAPNLLLETRSSEYIPLVSTSLKSFGKWIFQTGELLISEPEKIHQLKHLFIMKPIVLYVHGFTECVNQQSVRTILNAYLQRGDHTIILLDWSSIAQNSYYSTCVAKIPHAGKIIAKFLDETFNGKVVKDLTLDRIHVVSHSMGSQLSGCIGRNLTTGKFKRITALDPAGIIYKWLDPKFSLNKGDAEFVDAIHTDSGQIGLKKPCGHVDFYPNGGTRFQPGCPAYYSFRILNEITLCSHWLSWLFYAESVVSDKKAFMSCRATNWKAFKSGIICETETSPMGFHALNTANGEYFLQTNMVHPYSRGQSGIAYKEEW